MLVQGTLDDQGTPVFPSKPTVWVGSLDGSDSIEQPLTNAQFTAVNGAASATAWLGSGDGTMIAILKAIHAQNEEIKALLDDIKTNTSA